jgi:hypothetical protein
MFFCTTLRSRSKGDITATSLAVSLYRKWNICFLSEKKSFNFFLAFTRCWIVDCAQIIIYTIQFNHFIQRLFTKSNHYSFVQYSTVLIILLLTMFIGWKKNRSTKTKYSSVSQTFSEQEDLIVLFNFHKLSKAICCASPEAIPKKLSLVYSLKGSNCLPGKCNYGHPVTIKILLTGRCETVGLSQPLVSALT